MGCLVLLILAFIFRGALAAMLSAILVALYAVAALVIAMLNAGFWVLVAFVVICAIIAALS